MKTGTHVNMGMVASLFAALALNAGMRELPYVGQLYSGSTPVMQTQRFAFALYSAASGGSLLWSSGEVTQNVQRGYVSVNLGASSMTALPETLFDGRALFLEVQTAALGALLSTLTPRTNLTSTAYVHNAPRLGGVPAAAYQRTWTNVVVVGPGGPADGVDTNTLAGGLALAGGKATALDRYTLLLLPGIYDGGVASTNYVDIIGVARESCVITGALTIVHPILVENLSFNVAAPAAQAISVRAGRPTLNNLLIASANDGVSISSTAGGAQLLNLAMSIGGAGFAVRDARGVLIDGLRVSGNGVAAANMAPTALAIDYKNIAQMGGQYACQIGLPGVPGSGIGGHIRHVRAVGRMEINLAAELRVRDVVIERLSGVALQINGVVTKLAVQDARLLGETGIQYGQAGVTAQPLAGQSVFDDVTAIGQMGPALVTYLPAATVTVQHCELTSASGRPVDIATNALQKVTRALYIQTSLIEGPAEGINVEGATELWLYDSTVKSGLASVQGNVVLTPLPRIADCRLETDTAPSQGAGGAGGWNAFGGMGNAGGTGEDSRGNLVAPSPGVPVAP